MHWDRRRGLAIVVYGVARGNREAAGSLDGRTDMDDRWCGMRCPGQWASWGVEVGSDGELMWVVGSSCHKWYVVVDHESRTEARSGE